MKTVSKELAKQLKEKGFPQDSYFFWGEDHEGARLFSNKKFKDYSVSFVKKKEVYYYKALDGGNDILSDFIIGAAPTAEEILDILVPYLNVDIKGTVFVLDLTIIRGRGYWRISYGQEARTSYPITGEFDECLADVAAKMWLYLKENKLI